MYAYRITWERLRSLVLLLVALTLVLPVTAGAQRSLEGRHRIEFSVGYWDAGQRRNPLVEVHDENMTHVQDLVGTLSYSYYSHDQLATNITLSGLVADAISFESAMGSSDSVVVVSSLMLGARFYPFSSSRTPIRLYLSGGMGPYVGVQAYDSANNHNVTRVTTTASFGAYVGAGIDLQMGQYAIAGIQVTYNEMADFPEPIGLESRYNGVAVSAGISVLLGKGSRR
jgi:outer membrane protein W